MYNGRRRTVVQAYFCLFLFVQLISSGLEKTVRVHAWWIGEQPGS
jgi:hypothetical protein